ncbi:hypothetical protein [Neochlamydia sp. S13]|uniref:hypothetical protein n=1 Tax=Neochlamydia sp. S13 TaxID=1353976 RepID=UPI0005A94DD4|nr:hypothetical protein [Neochlamydia sp. S13]BBI17592.1 hypothetical protein NCS13_1_1397 [Neochlamydia sp. S13]
MNTQQIDGSSYNVHTLYPKFDQAMHRTKKEIEDNYERRLQVIATVGELLEEEKKLQAHRADLNIKSRNIVLQEETTKFEQELRERIRVSEQKEAEFNKNFAAREEALRKEIEEQEKEQEEMQKRIEQDVISDDKTSYSSCFIPMPRESMQQPAWNMQHPPAWNAMPTNTQNESYEVSKQEDNHTVRCLLA